MRFNNSFFGASFALFILAFANLPFETTAWHAAQIYHPKYIHTSIKSLQGRYLLELTAESNVDEMLDRIFENNLGIKVHRIFTHKFFTGLSIEVYDYSNIESLLDQSSVVSMSVNRMIKRASPIPAVKKAQPEKSSSLTPETIKSLMPHNISQVNRARQELNLTGQGVFIGIIDSGMHVI